jgi:hypothetical protein
MKRHGILTVMSLIAIGLGMTITGPSAAMGKKAAEGGHVSASCQGQGAPPCASPGKKTPDAGRVQPTISGKGPLGNVNNCIGGAGGTSDRSASSGVGNCGYDN